VGYRPTDLRYQELLDRVMAIFDAERAKGIDIKVIIEAAEALGQAGDPRFTDAARAENWVTIPAGEFLMGAQKDDPSRPNYDREAYEEEAPVHRVSLDAYQIARYPVTVGEYLRFVEAEGYEDESLWTQQGFGKWSTPEGWEEQLEHPTRPVVGVSWYEAAAYAAWMGCRLPTEAEWERAARGPEGRRYPWGDDKPDPLLLNYSESKINCPTPVGIYSRGTTPDGILDMAGNVWEWCSDWFAEYPKTGVKAPKGPLSGSGRVLRGGSWNNNPRNCRATYRNNNDPDERNDNIGFRLVSLSFGLALPLGRSSSVPRIPAFTDAGSVATEVLALFLSCRAVVPAAESTSQGRVGLVGCGSRTCHTAFIYARQSVAKELKVVADGASTVG